MANHDRDRWGFDREPERGRDRNRGMFGYEGEGYMQGDADRDRERLWRERGGMPDRVSGGRELDRLAERERDRDRFPERTRDGYGGRGDEPYGGGFDRFGGRERTSEPWMSRDHELPASYRGRGPRGYRRTDERLHEEVCERLAWDHDVDASDIEVAVAGGTVTLTGTVASRRMKRLAEDVAESVNGVEDVQNHLTIRRDEGGYGRHRDDEPLQSGVLGLTSTENLDEQRSRSAVMEPRGTGAGRAIRGSGAMNTPAADSTPITNPGAPGTGMGTSANSGIVSGHNTAGDRARRRR